MQYITPFDDFQSIIGVSGRSLAYLVTSEEYWLFCCSCVFHTDWYDTIGARGTYSDCSGGEGIHDETPHCVANIEQSLYGGDGYGERQESVDQIVMVF